jgi:hypothetical protein
MPFTQNKAPTYPLQPNSGRVQIANSDAQAQKTVYSVSADGASDINSLIAVSTDSVVHDLQVSVTNSGTSYPYGTVSVPAGAGNSSAVPTCDLLGQIAGLAFDGNGNPIIRLGLGDTLTVSAIVSVTSGKLITVSAACAEDY